jgi:hypothetical protein
MNLSFPTLGLNAAMHQIVDDLRVAGSGSDADASIPILFRPPNRVVEDFDPVCIPEFDPTVRTGTVADGGNVRNLPRAAFYSTSIVWLLSNKTPPTLL